MVKDIDTMYVWTNVPSPAELGEYVCNDCYLHIDLSRVEFDYDQNGEVADYAVKTDCVGLMVRDMTIARDTYDEVLPVSITATLADVEYSTDENEVFTALNQYAGNVASVVLHYDPTKRIAMLMQASFCRSAKVTQKNIVTTRFVGGGLDEYAPWDDEERETLENFLSDLLSREAENTSST